MKSFLFSFSFLTLTFFSNAQNWSDLMQRPDANLYQVQTSFYNYWQGKDITQKGKGYKAFKRWENFAAPRVYPSGDIGLLSQTAANYQEFLIGYQAQLNQNVGGKFGGGGNLIASATWTAMGPFGPLTGSAGGQLNKAGRLCFITIHPTNTLSLFVGAPAGGLWRSVDGGVSWTTNTDNLAVIGCSDLAIDPITPTIMYLATGDGDAGDTRSIGVLKSTDGGNTWNPTGLVFPVASNYLIRRLIVNPANTQIILAATNGGIYRTINGGTNWTQVNASTCYDLEFQPGNPNTVYAGGASFRRSTDGGATWTQIASGIPTTGVYRMAIAVTPADVNRVYVLAGNTTDNGLQGFYQSTSAGLTFTNMPTGGINLLGWNSAGNDLGGQDWYDLAIAASPINPNEVVTGGVNVWRTTTAGGSWSIYGHWTGSGAPFIHADQHDLEYDVNGVLYSSNDGTVYRRTALAWNEICGNMNISQIYKVGTSALTPNKWISGHQDNGTNIWNGTTYTCSIGGDGMDCYIDRTNDNNMFGETYNGSFRRSINGGANWFGYTTGMTGTPPWVTPWKQDPQTAGVIYGGYSNLFKSVLAAGSWTQLATLPAAGTINEFAVAPSNSLVIYVLKNAGIYKTIDGGTTWATVTGTVPVGSGAPTFVVIDPTDPNNAWVTLSGYSAGNKIFVTTNGGTTWTNFTANLPNIPANCAVYQPTTSDRIYIGMDVGVYYRDNLAASWTLYNTSLPNMPVFDMEISPADPTKLIAASYGRGMWKVDLIANLAPVSAFSYSGNPCTGVPIQFNDVSVNGPISWSWSVTPIAGVTINTPASQNPTITFANPGTYTVSLIATNGVGPGTTSNQTITINATPTVVVTSSVQTICSGTSANITASGAASYSWNTGAITNAITVSPTSTTIYSVTGSNGSCSTANTATVNVNPSPTIAVNSASICSGANAILTASGAASYLWSTGAITNTINISPGATTVYTVTGTSAGCSSANTSTVNVSTTPTVVLTGSVQTVCAGTTVNISASGAGTYSWNTGAVTNAINVAPNTTTIYTVTGSNGGCTSAKTATINVNPSPTVSVNSASICSGANVLLTASGAASYLWSTGAITNTISASPGVTTVYTVTGTSAGCNNIVTSTVNVSTTPTIAITNSVQTICAGSSVNISASGAGTYSWSNGAITNAINVAPNTTTIYTVTGSNGSCSTANTATVNVNPSPTVSVNNATICGGNAILTASGAGSYLWSTGAVTSTISVAPGVTTVYTVTGTVAGCTNSQTGTVTVNGLIVVVTNSAQTICLGSSTIITAGGATSYSWSTGANTNTISVSPGLTTIYTVTGTTGGCTDVKTSTVTVAGTPTVVVLNSVQTICAGSSININSSGAATYFWNTGATTSVIAVSPLSTTVYTVTGFNGSCSSSNTATVNVNPSPIINATTSQSLICDGSSVTLFGSGASTYTWQPGNLNGAVVTDTPLTTQIYTCTGTDVNGCIGTQTIMVTVAICTGKLQNGVESVIFNVYPNPASENITVSYPSNMSSEITLEIIDAAGKLINKKTQIFNKNNSTLSINISQVAKGAYFLKLIPKDGTAKTVKLIKE